VRVLKFDPVQQRAEVVTEMQRPRRSHPRHDALGLRSGLAQVANPPAKLLNFMPTRAPAITSLILSPWLLARGLLLSAVAVLLCGAYAFLLRCICGSLSIPR
jgi:hypothetical protein